MHLHQIDAFTVGLRVISVVDQLRKCIPIHRHFLPLPDGGQDFAQNRKYRAVLLPEDIPQKRAMLTKHHIAVWDVIASCEITGSSDASIRDVKPNDLSRILSCADIRAIYTNGGKANQLYQKYIFPVTGREAYLLPSTSPANAGYSLERLVEAWQVVGSLPDL